MKHFSDKVFERVTEKKSVLCVGIDPHFDKIPDSIKKNVSPAAAIGKFCAEVLKAVKEYSSIIKINLAFFELWGSEGFFVLETISQMAKKMDFLVIIDAKKNDIGSTAERYANAFLGANKPFDALTVNPFLGTDGILPFAEAAEKNGKGIFVLVKTSNQSAGEFQDLPVGDSLFFEKVGRSVARIGEKFLGNSNFSSTGAVVGATHPEDLKILRTEMPAQIFLIPGFGVQGGELENLGSAFYEGGKGAIVNSSRGILFADLDKDFAVSAALAAEKAKKDLQKIAKF